MFPSSIPAGRAVQEAPAGQGARAVPEAVRAGAPGPALPVLPHALLPAPPAVHALPAAPALAPVLLPAAPDAP